MRRSVLSIQSHVVHGHVGNKSATFPLQLLGFDVDPINAVQFSNHTGYPKFTGERLQSSQISVLLDGILDNGFVSDYSHILTGYIGNKSTLELIADFIVKVRKDNPSLIFVLDPVMGDNGKLYVSPEVIPVYRDRLCHLADIVTPNAFEAETLSGIKITNFDTAIKAVDIIHDLGAKIVIITSADLSSEIIQVSQTAEATSRKLHLIASQRLSDGSQGERFALSFPQLPGSFTGTGDLLAALLLAHLHITSKDKMICHSQVLNVSCTKALASVQAILKRTREKYVSIVGENHIDTGRGSADTKHKELCIVESKNVIEVPPEMVFDLEKI